MKQAIIVLTVIAFTLSGCVGAESTSKANDTGLSEEDFIENYRIVIECTGKKVSDGLNHMTTELDDCESPEVKKGAVEGMECSFTGVGENDAGFDESETVSVTAYYPQPGTNSNTVSKRLWIDAGKSGTWKATCDIEATGFGKYNLDWDLGGHDAVNPFKPGPSQKDATDEDVVFPPGGMVIEGEGLF